MRKSRLTKTQIIKMTKGQESGLTVAEVCRKHGVSPAMGVSVARRQQELEEIEPLGRHWVKPNNGKGKA